MEKLKKKNDLGFLFVCLKIGIGALIYRGGLDLMSYVFLPIVSLIVMKDPENISLTNSVTYAYSAIISVAAFLFAAIFLWIFLRVGKRQNYKATYWKPSFTILAPFLIISTVAINFAMAEINAILMYLLYPGVESLSMTGTAGVGISLLEIILLFVSTAVIPGIVEEIMFRGIILTNLEPYGKGTAIVVSAFLFGLMHMNPAQFFYTTLMGIVLGYVYVKTRSIWICIITHFTNNALGVLQQIIFQSKPLEEVEKYLSIMTLAVILLGVISMGVLLISRAYDCKRLPEELGSFGRICATDLSYAEAPVTRARKPLLIFSGSIGLFTAIVFVAMIVTMIITFFAGLILGVFPGVITL